jgi:hypothetical protein
VVVAATDADEFTSDLSAVESEVCDPADADKVCQAPVPECAVVAAASCVEGRCVVQSESDTVAIEGRPYDATGECVGELEVAGTTTCQDGPPIISWVLDANGECWMFASGCIPDDFTRVSDSEEHPCFGNEAFCSPP